MFLEACETTHGGNGYKKDDENNPPKCKFPFDYRGERYERCINKGEMPPGVTLIRNLPGPLTESHGDIMSLVLVTGQVSI